jgi:hypothetical protein
MKTIAGCTHHRSRRMVSPKCRWTIGSCARAMQVASNREIGIGWVVAAGREPAGIFGRAVPGCQ